MVPYFDCREEGEGVESRKHQHTLIVPVSNLCWFQTIGDYMTSPSWFFILSSLFLYVFLGLCFHCRILWYFFSPFHDFNWVAQQQLMILLQPSKIFSVHHLTADQLVCEEAIRRLAGATFSTYVQPGSLQNLATPSKPNQGTERGEGGSNSL